MASANLPSTGSIVDYLKSSGQDASFGSRRKLYAGSGMDKRLGEYVGSKDQNLALLKQLQSTSKAPVSTPSAVAVVDTFKSGTQTSTPMTAASTVGTLGAGRQENLYSADPGKSIMTPYGPVSGGSTPTGPASMGQKMSLQDILTKTLGTNYEPRQTLLPVPTAAPEPTPTPAASTTTAPVTAPAGGTSTAVEAPKIDANYQLRKGESPEAYNQRISEYRTKNSAGVSAEDVAPGADSDEADLVMEWLNSAEGQLATERQALAGMDAEAANEEARAELEAKYAEEKTSLEEKLAENGLAFSGVRASKVKALADSLASSLIGVDREFASKLLDANLDLRESILKGVADIAADAKEGRKEAIQQLNAVGWAVIGDELVPTLASRSADRADRQLEISEARLALAEESAARAEARFAQLYGEGRGSEFNALYAAIEAEPSATDAERKAWALQNTTLKSEEIDAILEANPMTGTQLDGTAQQLVGTYFSKEGAGAGWFTLEEGDLERAKNRAKTAINGGAIKMNGKTVSLNPDTKKELTVYIDAVSLEEAKAVAQLAEK